MAALSEKKKTEVLESAVLRNDIAELEKVLSDYAPFEFIARALGFACRYCGIEMVKMLVSHGADFSTEGTEFLSGKYGTNTHTSSDAAGGHGFLADYSLLLVINNLKDDRRVGIITRGLSKEFDDVFFENKSIIDENDRLQILEFLIESNLLSAIQTESLLYHAIANGSKQIASFLTNQGITITEQDTSNVWDSTYRNELEDPHRRYYDALINGVSNYERTEFVRYLSEAGDHALYIIDSLIGLFAKNNEKLKITKNVYDVLPDRAITREYRTKMDMSSVSVMEEYERVLKTNNTELMSILIDGGCLKNTKSREKMLKKANETGNVEIVSLIMEFINNQVDLQMEAKKRQKADNESLKVPTPLNILKAAWGFKKQEDGTLLIVSYKGESTKVEMPGIIGKSVVSAFDKKTFDYCNDENKTEVRRNIVRITIPGSCKEVPKRAFSFNHKLSEVILLEGVKRIGEMAFEDTIIEALNIPATIDRIEDEAFDGCRTLKRITVDENNKHYCDIDGVLYSKDHKKLIYYPVCRADEHYVIPEETEEIGDRAFQHSQLKTIDIPLKLRKIGTYSFGYCKNLKEIKLPDTVCDIGDYPFIGCDELVQLVIPEGVSHYDDWPGRELKEIVFLGSETTTYGYKFENIVIAAKKNSKIYEFISQYGEKRNITYREI